ncbi:hypothetical protein OEB96_36255 [Paraliomyxa miuraensis]|nr:hypothetical protein [Paraliomyxa miuraensis]
MSLGACKEEPDELGELFGSALIGPDGGEVVGGSVTLTIPAGALTAETEIELRRLDDYDLSPPGYSQQSATISIEPHGLVLRQPGTLAFGGDRGEDTQVAFQQDSLEIIAPGTTAYINELSRATTVRPQEGTTPTVVALEPMFGVGPDDPGPLQHDAVHFQLQVSDTPELALVMTIYDVDQAYDRPLNGMGSGECGFRTLNVTSGSLAGDCSDGRFTSLIRTTGSTLTFDTEPHLSGKLQTPVLVGVVAGRAELAHHLGFFRFETGPCFDETCSGLGTCVAQGSTGTCECQDGFEGVGFECVCMPQCDGKVCGPDGCGGGCGGCDTNESCNQDGTACVPDEPPPPGDSSDGGSSDGGSTSGGSTSGGSSGGSSTGGSTT